MAMREDILANVARQLEAAMPRLQEAKDMMAALDEAGEDTSSLRQEINQVEERVYRWQAMLRARGIIEAAD